MSTLKKYKVVRLWETTYPPDASEAVEFSSYAVQPRLVFLQKDYLLILKATAKNVGWCRSICIGKY